MSYLVGIEYMSKIGRQPIRLSSAKVQIDGSKISINGSKAKFEHTIPDIITATIDAENCLKLDVKDRNRKNNTLWGLHRALLANMVQGAERGFEQKVTIVGLGYKAIQSGNKLTFSLGYSNKIEYDLPEGVSVQVDKSGQQLVFSSSDKGKLGDACDTVRYFRRPEPYKGTGIIRENDVVIRKAGKTKSS